MTESKRKSIQPVSEEQSKSEVATPSQEEMLARFNEALKALGEMRKTLEDAGVKLEVPPTETTVVRQAAPIVPGANDAGFAPLPTSAMGKVKPGTVVNGVPRPWTREDLEGQDKFDFVPQFIPGAVHPIEDANGKFHIFLDVNNLQCCLTVWELNRVSGMFYWAYKNIEDQWKLTEEFKKKGPINGPHVTGGLGGQNTWYYQGQAPAAWINLEGGYYKPGDAMPLDDIPLERPAA